MPESFRQSTLTVMRAKMAGACATAILLFALGVTIGGSARAASPGRAATMPSGLVIGVVHYVGGPTPLPGSEQLASGQVTVRNVAGRVVARPWAHTRAGFRVRLKPGRYTLQVGAREAGAPPECPAAHATVRAHAVTHVAIYTGCNVP
jgi:hypothetical protein